MSEFDEKARIWDADPVKIERARAVAAAIAERVPLDPSMRALEYGCGTGEVSMALQTRLGRITLADTSEGMLEVLREKIAARGIANMQPVALDLVSDPPPKERYDLIYSAMTLHHIPETDRLLGRFRDLLTPGGHLCIADLDLENGAFHGAGFQGHHGFDRSDLAGRAERAGFTEIKFSTVFEIEKEAGGSRRTFPVFLMTSRKK